MDRPLVSICVPTYNRAPMLRQSLRTICAQTYAPLEILISDDASTDDTGALCRDLAERDPRVRYVRQPRRLGLYPNHNWCIDEGRGDFLCLFHDDDQHHPDLVSESMAFLDRHPEVGIVCSDWDLIDEAGQQVGVREHEVPDVMPGLEYISRTIRRGQSYIGCPGAVIKRSALGATRLREDGPIGFADFVVWFQIAERAAVGHIPKRLWRYRLHRRSFSRRSIESATYDYHFNLNRYCDEHLTRWPGHAELVGRWRREIDRYLFWSLMYEVGLHFGRRGALRSETPMDRSVYEISNYDLSSEELGRVLRQLRSYRSGPAQASALLLLRVLLRLKITRPLAWAMDHSGTLRKVLGFR